MIIKRGLGAEPGKVCVSGVIVEQIEDDSALDGLRLEPPPDKTFIGRVARGFDFLGYHFGPHGLTVDARGNIYVGKVSYTSWPSTYGDARMPKLLRTLQKLEKVAWWAGGAQPEGVRLTLISGIPCPIASSTE